MLEVNDISKLIVCITEYVCVSLIHIYICIYMCVCVYIYIQIDRYDVNGSSIGWVAKLISISRYSDL